MNPKHWLGSRTIWVNTLGGIISTVGLVSGAIPVKYAPIITAVGGIANILLRTITTQPLTTGSGTGTDAGSRNVVGVGMILLTLGLTIAACASFPPHRVDGSLDVPVLLEYAQAGIDADCKFGATALTQDLCTFGTDAISTAQAIAAKNPATIRAAVKQSLLDSETKLPPASAVRPYLDWLIPLL